MGTDRPRPIVIAIVPFGARAASPRAGAWARQLARRLVERFAGDEGLELRPVFLVAMSEETSGEGHLIFGSTPTPDLAAQYGASLSAAFVVIGTYDETAEPHEIRLQLIDVATKSPASEHAQAVAAADLHLLEIEIATWLRRALGRPPVDERPVTANADAYAALLEGMDEEVNAMLLRESDPDRSRAALSSALHHYVAAARLDPDARAPEERLLVVGAESLERGDATAEVHALEELIGARPRAWRAHYLLGQLRAEAGDANGAILAFEHAHALHPLPDTDIVKLAELYANTGAIASGLAHLRRLKPESASYGAAQELAAIVAYQRGDIASGHVAFSNAVTAGATSWELHASRGAAAHARGELADALDAYAAALAQGAPPVVRLNRARVLLAQGDRDAALADLDALLESERVGEVAGHARRLRFGLRHPDLERDLEGAGQLAVADAERLDEAASAFERALAADADLWEAHFGVGLVARQRGDASAARAAFQRVLDLWPDQPDALHELGVALVMGDEMNAAVRALDRAASLRPDDAAYIADAGFAHLRAGNLESARRHIERAAALDANDPITRTYLGELERVESEVGRRAQ